jgi:uncharacterized protein DUF6924
VIKLPKTDNTLLLRSEYSDDAAWKELCRLVEAPSQDDFRANLTFVEHPELNGKSVPELMAIVEGGEYRSFFFIADQEAIYGRGHPVLVVDLADQRGRTFRVIPSEMWSVENNLSLANMDFDEFAEGVDSEGVFRGFSD